MTGGSRYVNSDREGSEMKVVAKILTGIGVVAGVIYLCCRFVGEKLHVCRK